MNMSLAGQTILMAEDSDLIRFVTKRQLALLGLACDGARDGQEALTLWQRNPTRYWLLLTDLEMPQVDGFDLARAIRSDCSAGARLPIVAYTGKAPASTTASPSPPTCISCKACCNAGSRVQALASLSGRTRLPACKPRR
jgi:CheY-like chemotaxis protein